jgi:hypothetical protein
MAEKPPRGAEVVDDVGPDGIDSGVAAQDGE